MLQTFVLHASMTSAESTANNLVGFGVGLLFLAIMTYAFMGNLGLPPDQSMDQESNPPSRAGQYAWITLSTIVFIAGAIMVIRGCIIYGQS